MRDPKFRERPDYSINAGSMADIAFLLLIFFLVTTTISVDKGIKVKLPPWTTDLERQPIATHNVFRVRVNANNELFVRGELAEMSELREKVKTFILNPEGRADLAEKPSKAIISMQNDRGTAYETYLEVYNELVAAYNDLWEIEAQKTLGEPFSENLPKEIKRKIRSKIPFVVSEAEPSNFENLGSLD